MKQATLLFLIDHDKILLAMKKRGFGAGKWNGSGGKVKDGESIEQAAIRECQEEINVTPVSLKEVAVNSFYFPKNPEWDQQVTIYLCDKWSGKPTESEEMTPKWFKISDLPYQEMWSSDHYWLPKVLDGNYVDADFYFDEKNEVIKQKIESIIGSI